MKNCFFVKHLNFMKHKSHKIQHSSQKNNMESDQNNPGNSARKPVYPILSNRQIYPGSPGSRKVSPQKDFTGSSNSLTGSDHGGSRKFLNLIHEGAKFCLVQGDQGKKLFIINS